MKLSHIVGVLSEGTFAGSHRVARVLPRYAAMRGVEITERQINFAVTDPAMEMEIGAEDAKAILALDFAERQNEHLRALGEGIGKINIPSNINVWQHLKGEGAMASAARGLTEVAKALTDKITA